MEETTTGNEEARLLRVAITAADAVVLTLLNDTLHVLLMPIDLPPYYPHCFGLPGGILRVDESARDAAARCLKDKAGVSGIYMEQLHAYSAPGRDLRSRSVSIAYLGLVAGEAAASIAGSSCLWAPISALPALAFDHAEMITDAAARLQVRIKGSTLAAHLLPPVFTLAHLQTVYEVVLQRPRDKRNFRRTFAELNLLTGAGVLKAAAGRPAELFRFAQAAPVDAEIL